MRVLVLILICLCSETLWAREEPPTFIIEGPRFNQGQANDYRIGNFDAPLTKDALLQIIDRQAYELTDHFDLDYGRYFYFIHVIENRSGRTQTIYLRYPSLCPETKGWLVQGHELVPVQRYPRFGDTLFLDVPPGTHRMIATRFSLVQMRGKATGVRMMDEASLVREWADIDVITSAIFGAVMAMILYNLAMYLVYRRIYFVHYAVYSCSSLYVLAMLSNYVNYDGKHLGAAVIIGGAALLAFCQASLSLRRKFPRLYRASLGIGAFNVLMSGYTVVTGNWLGYSLSMPVVMAFSLYTSIASLRSGYRPAFYFVLGWGIFMTSACLVLLNVVLWGVTSINYVVLFGFAFEISLFSFAIGQKVRLSEQEALQANHHAFSQLRKVFYPHQITHIKEGFPIEATMPTYEHEAVAICFDIVGSSRIEATLGRSFIEDSIKACVSKLMVDYDEASLVAAGYRVKEMGDGFLCTVGYPFRLPRGMDPVCAAMELALSFAAVFQEEVDRLDGHPPIFCSIALAFGKVQGHFPKNGAVEYHVGGPAVELAQRYESFRQHRFPEGPGAHIITVHRQFFDQLPSHLQEGFVRATEHLYYCLLSADSVSGNLQITA